MGYAIKRQPNTVTSLEDTDLLRVSDATSGTEKKCSLSTMADYILTGGGIEVNTGVTAYAGGGQANATELEGGLNIVSTVATEADSVKLVTDENRIQVINDAALDLAVFPESGAAIDGFGTNGVYYLAPGSSQTFIRTGAAAWTRLNRTLRYVDRGDGSAWDFDETTLSTQNGTWNDVDLSSIVPPSGAGSLIKARVAINAAAQQSFSLRPKGNSNAFDAVAVASGALGLTVNGGGDLLCDSSRVIQYLTTGTAGTDLYVRGWWVEG